MIAVPNKLTLWLCIVASLICNVAHAAISVRDDANQLIQLQKPAKRIITLAPHATELIFEAGAGSVLVGVSEYSDFPPEAKKIPSVGNIFALDVERIIALKPDLIIVWGTGNGRNLANKLRDSKLPIFESDPRDFETIASNIERLSVLSGNEKVGYAAAKHFRARLAKLRQLFTSDHQSRLTVFYQISASPLMTINHQHIISSAIRLCGGKNIFDELNNISPTINSEAVIAANPDAIIFSEGEKLEALSAWSHYPQLTFLKSKHQIPLNGDWIYRPTSRFLDGTEQLCRGLAALREK